ncbi:MAG: hypothetical protein U0271_03370 [Polyangiaceae bacterium]
MSFHASLAGGALAVEDALVVLFELAVEDAVELAVAEELVLVPADEEVSAEAVVVAVAVAVAVVSGSSVSFFPLLHAAATARAAPSNSDILNELRMGSPWYSRVRPVDGLVLRRRSLGAGASGRAP